MIDTALSYYIDRGDFLSLFGTCVLCAGQECSEEIVRFDVVGTETPMGTPSLDEFFRHHPNTRPAVREYLELQFAIKAIKDFL